MSEGALSHQNSDTSVETLGDDLLIGADAVAQELNWKTQDGKWNRRRVYHLAEVGQVPIHRVKGIGICARKSGLKAFFAELDSRFVKRVDASSIIS